MAQLVLSVECFSFDSLNYYTFFLHFLLFSPILFSLRDIFFSSADIQSVHTTQCALIYRDDDARLELAPESIQIKIINSRTSTRLTKPSQTTNNTPAKISKKGLSLPDCRKKTGFTTSFFSLCCVCCVHQLLILL